MSHDMTKSRKWACAQRRQTSLGIHPVWKVFAVRMKKDWVLSYPLSAREDSDQTWRMPRLICVFAGRTLILLVLSCRGAYNLSNWQYVWESHYVNIRYFGYYTYRRTLSVYTLGCVACRYIRVGAWPKPTKWHVRPGKDSDQLTFLRSLWLFASRSVAVAILSHLMTKPTKWHVRLANTQISMDIRPVWSESSLSAWRKLGYLAIHWAHSKDSDQTGRMPRLIWVFAGRIVILLVLSWGGSFEPVLYASIL